MKMLKFRLDKTNIISYYTNMISLRMRGELFYVNNND
jgi:hypothetical protein